MVAVAAAAQLLTSLGFHHWSAGEQGLGFLGQAVGQASHQRWEGREEVSLGAPLQVGSLAQQPTKPASYLPRPDPHSKGKRHPWAPQAHGWGEGGMAPGENQNTLWHPAGITTLWLQPGGVTLSPGHPKRSRARTARTGGGVQVM